MKTKKEIKKELNQFRPFIKDKNFTTDEILEMIASYIVKQLK